MLKPTKTIYLDHAATTQLSEGVLNEMMPYLTTNYGNANSSHIIGRAAAKGLDEARDVVAKIMGCDRTEIYFTSGGSEGDNWAVRGATYNRGEKNKLVISNIEHSAMLSSANFLESMGIEVERVNPDKNGFITPSNFESAITNNTYLASCMWTNNEFGTIQPIKELCKVAHDKGALFFADSVQAVGTLKIDLKDTDVDMISCSSHKFGGPKGAGFVYIKNGTNFSSIISGGFQERGKRGGTSNVAGAMGTAKALQIAYDNIEHYTKYVTNIRNYFIDRVLTEVPNTILNGDRTLRAPNNANITFKGVDGFALLAQLDLNGICASLGSACFGGAIEPSYVLLSLGLSREDALSTLRFTFGTEITKEDVDYTVHTLKQLVNKLNNLK